MKKIMTYISFAVIMYAVFGAMAGLCYLMSDVWGWAWYINLCNGLTYSQYIVKAMSTPLTAVIMAIELFVMIPLLGWALGDMWMKARATEN